VNEFRVIIFSSKPPAKLVRIVERIRRELPEVTGIAIVYETLREKPLGKRLRGILGRISEPHYLAFVFDRTLRMFLRPIRRAGDAILRFLHAAPRNLNPRLVASFDDLQDFAKRNGIAILLTNDLHSDESLAFVREFRPNLGVVFGTKILKPALYEIPRLGSINVHKKKVPDYRGGGPTGLWELLEGAKEIGITVHGVTTNLDGGPVLQRTTMRIDPYDRLDSLALKADVVGNDLLIQTIRDMVKGTGSFQEQTGEARTFRNPSDHQLLAYRRELDQRLTPYDRPRGRPMWKLLLRSIVLYPFLTFRNWNYRFRQSFPVIILYHHLITDRPHHLGLPTSEFVKQVEYLRRHYHIASLPEAMEMLEAGRVKAPTVVLTFDDGYAENYINLRAVTEEYRIPVFLFVSTAHMRSQASFGHDLRRGQSGFSSLSWEQVVVLHRAGFGFGSHTRTHFDCGSTDEVALKSEIVDSKSELESHLGEPVDYFSFPWGMPVNISEPGKKLALQSYSYSYAAAGGINPAGMSTRQILRRCDHPPFIFDLELLLQSVLEFDNRG